MKICKVDGCDSVLGKNCARGYCSKHYQRYMRHGDAGINLNHGLSQSSEYSSWSCMIQRCLNKNNSNYYLYGGRKIKVCRKWVHSFETFYKDMGPKPFPKAQIDRINNNGNYEPSNCQWVTNRKNTQHTRATKLNMDKARSIRELYPSIGTKELSKRFGISQRHVYSIIHNKAWINSLMDDLDELDKND